MFRYRHRTKSISDIQIPKIDQSFPNDPINFLVLLILSRRFRTHILHVRNLASYHCATRPGWIWNIGQKFIPISDIMLDSAHFSPISDVPISGSVRYRWSRISDWVPTYDHIVYKPVCAYMYSSFMMLCAKLQRNRLATRSSSPPHPECTPCWFRCYWLMPVCTE